MTPRGMTLAFALALLSAGLSNAWGHPGGLDAQGCHTNRKTGDYHCHRAAAAAPSGTPDPATRSSAAPLAAGPVKRSSTGICHAPGSSYYQQAQKIHAVPLPRGMPEQRR